MSKYKVIIEERLTKIVIIEAENPHKAESLVSDAWYRGEHILSADDFSGVDFYAEDTEVDNHQTNGLRFSDDDIEHAMLRLNLFGKEGRGRVIHILRNWDRGHGDIDDIIDEFEDAPAY